jgi:AmiR/NasT family two-component response regulator
MAVLARVPIECVALVVENEPVQAFALECMLEELGCRPVGPASRLDELEKLVEKNHPNFALLETNMVDEDLEPLAECLVRYQVPFALLAIGPEREGIAHIPSLHGRPRLGRPFHPPSLAEMAHELFRADLAAKLAASDQRISAGADRLARQLQLVERLEQAGRDSGQAVALAREIGRVLRTMRASRQILAGQLETVGQPLVPRGGAPSRILA